MYNLEKLKNGIFLLFKSKNLKDWQIIGEVAGSNLNNLDNYGYMWECPDLITLNNKEILISSPQGVKLQKNLNNKIIDQSGYLVGKLDYQTGKLEYGEFKKLDQGFDFYAPQTTVDKKNRRIFMSYLQMEEMKGVKFYIYETSIKVENCSEVIKYNRQPNLADVIALSELIELGKKIKTDEIKGKVKALQGLLNL